MWTERMLHELEDWQDASFVTLTFSPDYPAYRASLEPKLLEQFFKRLRYHLGSDRKIRYFACGEYGDSHGAAHYHSIVFGLRACGDCEQCSSVGRRRGNAPLERSDCSAVSRAWQYGFCDIRGVGPESAGYVAKYVTKFDRRKLVDVEPPFQRASQRLGSGWFYRNFERCWRECGIRKRGSVIALPRYYVKLANRRFCPKPVVGDVRVMAHDVRQECLASWFIGRMRWRALKERSMEHESELLKLRKSQEGAFGYDRVVRAERDQHRRNVEAGVEMKERQI